MLYLDDCMDIGMDGLGWLCYILYMMILWYVCMLYDCLSELELEAATSSVSEIYLSFYWSAYVSLRESSTPYYRVYTSVIS